MAETLGVNYEWMVQVIQDGWRGALPPPLAQMERSLAKVRSSAIYSVTNLKTDAAPQHAYNWKLVERATAETTANELGF